MDIPGYFAAILIGISLGLIGGGGSVLTVPVLVYLFRVNAVLATTYSLFVVGAASALGSFSYFKKGLVQLRSVLLFGLPSIAAVFLARSFLLPAIPATLFTVGGFTLTKDILLLLLFAVLMLVAARSMIRQRELVGENDAPLRPSLVVGEGLLVGALTGLVGAGGGFLIIPVLVNVLKMPMKTAIGTSLVIITLNSLSGFVFSLAGSHIQWQFLLSITAVAMIGILIGSRLSNYLEGQRLRPVFGWFVLLMGVFIILRETLLP